MKQKLYVVASIAEYYDNGYKVCVWDSSPYEGAEGYALLAEFEAEVPEVSKEEAVAKCFPKLDKMRQNINAEAGVKQAQVDRLQAKLLQLTHMPVTVEEQHEPEAEDAQVVEETQDWYFTFGGGSEHANRYCVAQHMTFNEAREAMVAKFGKNWASQYNEEKFAGQIEEYGLSLLFFLTSDKPIDEDDDVPF